MKRNLAISLTIGILASYLPFWQWENTQAVGAAALALLAWFVVQGTAPTERRG